MNSFKSSLKRVLHAVLGTAAVAAMVHLAGEEHIPVSGVIMTLAVIFWSWREGLAGGGVSAVLSIFFLALNPVLLGKAPPWESSTSAHLLLWALCLPIAALLVGTVSGRAERFAGAEREKKRLKRGDHRKRNKSYAKPL